MAASRPRTMPTQTSPDPAAPTFAGLGLPGPLVETLTSAGITDPFPIQAGTLPHSLSGRDVLGRGRTGSGKTYAFLLPLVASLAKAAARRVPGRPRGLILVPTRELASQVDEALAPLAAAMSLRTMTVFGGVPANRQIRSLRDGVDIVIACPGRLADLVQSGHAQLSGVQVTVLDEADHMADLGFLPVVRRLLDQTPRNGQRLLFSATLDAGVDVLVKRYLDEPVVHSVDSAQSPVDTMEHHVFHVAESARLAVITDLAAAPGKAVIFTRTKHGAKALARKLNARGVGAVELHGNLSQNARTRSLDSFASGVVRTLVATDVAARGIHVDDVSLVVHADPPAEHKAYVHRSGRTARAGAQGTVVTIMLDAQVRDVRDLTRRAGITPVTTRVDVGHPMLVKVAPGDRSFQAGLEPAIEGRGGTTGARSRAGRRGAAGNKASATAPAERRRRRRSGRATSTNNGATRGHSAASFSAGNRAR